MHRHGYKGRKFGREVDARRALMKGLAADLIKRESITTTVPKAKELVPYVEKLITKAKKGDLHNRRQVIGKVAHVEAAHKLVDDIAPKLGARTSGHLRIERTGHRQGDFAPLAKVSFVDSLKDTQPAATEPKASPAKMAKPVAKKKAATEKK